ncbi:MAG TPA: hypothetical protein VF337_09955 [Candidatus Limnocylindrales bacterium]
MDDRVWKNISIALGVICALLIGVAGALMFLGHKSPSTDSTNSFPAVSGATQSPGSGSGPTVVTSPGAATPAGPTPTAGKASPATMAFTGLTLDAMTDTSGAARTFTFTSDGSGPVTFAVTKISSGGTAKLCISVDDSAYACKIGTPSKLPNFLTSKADQIHDKWSMTLIGYNASAPTVDVTFTWPTAAPKVTLTHGRFQGTENGLNGFTATFQPRAAGSVNVQSAWTLLSTDASMTLYDATTQPAVSVETKEYKGVAYLNPAYTATLDPTKKYQIKLQRTSSDSSERPDLTAEISFP